MIIISLVKSLPFPKSLEDRFTTIVEHKCIHLSMISPPSLFESPLFLGI